MHRILIVDDDRETCRFIEELLAAPGREVTFEVDPRVAGDRISRESFDLLVSDINLNAATTGIDLLRTFKAAQPSGHVVLISGFGTLQTAVEAVRAGAFDYISKPFDIGAVKATVTRALAASGTIRAARRPTLTAPPPGLIGRTAVMLEVYKQIAHAADSVAPVLIIGESGTGKELVAKAIHANSARAHRPFVPINCGAITESLLESELFGHARGAFTGAVADTKGIFEQAHGGTVFLDEIGETSPALQVKLLRALEEGEIRPVGGRGAIRVDARVLAATNVELELAVSQQRFRQDLYYRLSVVVVRMPALRDRRADIPLLVSDFLEGASARAGRSIELTPAALDALVAHDWPGNVRELQNTLERLVMFTPGSTADVADLPAALQQVKSRGPEPLFEGLPTLDEVERRYLVHVLAVVGANRTRAAEVLGIDRRTLYRMAERFGIDLRDDIPG